MIALFLERHASVSAILGLGIHPYRIAFLVVFLLGLYVLVDSSNLIQKIVGLNLLQISVFLLLVTVGYVDGANPPLADLEGPHANPLPHAMVLTAIVVGVSLTALALALTVRLHEEFGTIDVDEIERALAKDGVDVDVDESNLELPAERGSDDD